MEAEVGMMWGHKQLLTVGKGKETGSPQNLQEELVLPTPRF